MPSKPKFSRGDIVQHKASEEFAVVEEANYRCTKHTGFGFCVGGCVYEFSGSYKLEIGFNTDSIIVYEDMLIGVEVSNE